MDWKPHTNSHETFLWMSGKTWEEGHVTHTVCSGVFRLNTAKLKSTYSNGNSLMQLLSEFKVLLASKLTNLLTDNWNAVKSNRSAGADIKSRSRSVSSPVITSTEGRDEWCWEQTQAWGERPTENKLEELQQLTVQHQQVCRCPTCSSPRFSTGHRTSDSLPLIHLQLQDNVLISQRLNSNWVY